MDNKLPDLDLLNALIKLAFDWAIDRGVDGEIWEVRVESRVDDIESGIAAIRPTRESALVRAREILCHPRWNEDSVDIVEAEQGRGVSLRCGKLKVRVEPQTIAALLRSMGISNRALSVATIGPKFG
ncbi:MAG: hypothetical protein WCT32_00765 [Patescibacteria group bacterium]|jgi:hypothetical protein